MSHALYKDGYAALEAMCAGKSSQEISHHLISVDGIWHEKKLETGAARVRACMNKEKHEFFKFSELIAISKFTKCNDAIFFMCDELGLSRPQPISVQDQLSSLNQVVTDATQVLAVATEQLTRIENQEVPDDSNVVRVMNFCNESLMP